MISLLRFGVNSSQQPNEKHFTDAHLARLNTPIPQQLQEKVLPGALDPKQNIHAKGAAIQQQAHLEHIADRQSAGLD